MAHHAVDKHVYFTYLYEALWIAHRVHLGQLALIIIYILWIAM